MLTPRSQDGFFLARLMSHPNITREALPTVLQIYDEIRRPFTQNIVALARRRGQLHHLDSPELAWLTAERSAKGDALNREQLDEISEMMERCRDWQFGPSVLEESAAAMEKLDAVLWRPNSVWSGLMTACLGFFCIARTKSSISS